MSYRPYTAHKHMQQPQAPLRSQPAQQLQQSPQIQQLHKLPHPSFPKTNMLPVNASPQIQEVLQNYNILCQIGEGTFGLVLKASTKKKHKNLPRLVAIKKLVNHDPSQGFHITTLREIKAFKSLKHKNLLPLIEVLQSSSKNAFPDTSNNNKINLCDVYLVLPYLSSDLAGLISNANISFLESEIKCFTIQLLEGINFLHNKGFVHRDIKTANILVSSNNILKIADFGLTRKYCSSSHLVSSLPNKKGCVHGGGTQFMTTLVVARWYRAPELLFNEKQYTTAIDMWSIGCIFAEFFVRKPLLTGNTNSSQLNEIFKLVGSPVPKGKFPLFDKLNHDRLLFLDTSQNSSTSKNNNNDSNHDKALPPAVMTSSTVMSTTAAAAEVIPTTKATTISTTTTTATTANIVNNSSSNTNPDVVDFQQLKMKYPGTFNQVFSKLLHPAALNLLSRLLTLDPNKRFNALDCLDHEWFKLSPMPCSPEEIQSFESRHEIDIRLERSHRHQQHFIQQQKVQHNSKKDILNFLDDDSFLPTKRQQQQFNNNINNNFSGIVGISGPAAGSGSALVNNNGNGKVNTTATRNRNRSNSNNSARSMGSLIQTQDITTAAANNNNNPSLFLSPISKNLKNYNAMSQQQYAIPSPLNTVNIHHAESPTMPTSRSPFDLFQSIGGGINYQGTTPASKSNHNSNGNLSLAYFAKSPDSRSSLSQMIRSESQNINENYNYNEGNGNSNTSSWRRSLISNAGSFHQRQHSDASSSFNNELIGSSANVTSNNTNNNKQATPSVKLVNLKLVKSNSNLKSFDLKNEGLFDRNSNSPLNKRTSLTSSVEEENENEQEDGKSFYSAISHSQHNSISSISGNGNHNEDSDGGDDDIGGDSTFLINNSEADFKPPFVQQNMKESSSSSSLVLSDITEVLSNSTKRTDNNNNNGLSSPVIDPMNKNNNKNNDFNYMSNSFYSEEETSLAESIKSDFQKPEKNKASLNSSSSLKKSRSFGNLANILKSTSSNNDELNYMDSNGKKNKKATTNLSNSVSTSNINEPNKSHHKHSILKPSFFKKKKNPKESQSSSKQQKQNKSHHLPTNSYRKFAKTNEEYEEEQKIIAATKIKQQAHSLNSNSSNNNNSRSGKSSISHTSSSYKVLPKSISDRHISKSVTNSSNFSGISRSSTASSTASNNLIGNGGHPSVLPSSSSELSKSPSQQSIHPYKKFSKLLI